MRRKYAVIGDPVEHSLSPVIHQQFGLQTGIQLSYEKIRATKDNFQNTVEQFFNEGGHGLNITLPHKASAFELADFDTERAVLAKAANTLWLDGGDIYAENTDGTGIVRDITVNHQVSLTQQKILILGAGGAVSGILGPILSERPGEVIIINRTIDKANKLVQMFSQQYRDIDITTGGFDAVKNMEIDIVINGTSLSLQQEVPNLPSATVKGAFCYDMAYQFSQSTVFETWCQEQGAAKAVDGIGMLVEQAAESFYLWHAVMPDTQTVINQLRSKT